MKKHMAILIILIVILTACKPQTFGEPIKESKVTSISEVLDQRESKTTFRLEGKIGAVCPSGCWFYLKDASGEIFVDINPSGFAIPQKSGKQAIVEGAFMKIKRKPIFVATGVEIK
jgi:uncharacterized protein YdeI (BOF family)